MHTIATAAAAVGRNKTAILRAIKDGKISVTKDENGEWQIDPVELHRIYPPLSNKRTFSIAMTAWSAKVVASSASARAARRPARRLVRQSRCADEQARRRSQPRIERGA
jgi:hypothetical protein